MGDVFASPSAEQVNDVAIRAQDGKGAFLACGDYAVDVLDFDESLDAVEAVTVALTVRVAAAESEGPLA